MKWVHYRGNTGWEEFYSTPRDTYDSYTGDNSTTKTNGAQKINLTWYLLTPLYSVPVIFFFSDSMSVASSFLLDCIERNTYKLLIRCTPNKACVVEVKKGKWIPWNKRSDHSIQKYWHQCNLKAWYTQNHHLCPYNKTC